MVRPIKSPLFKFQTVSYNCPSSNLCNTRLCNKKIDSIDHKLFAKMPNTDSTTRPRRSPRFLRTDTLDQEPTPSCLRKSTRTSRLAQERQGSSGRSLSSAKKSRKCWSEGTVSEKLRKPREGFESRRNPSTGSKKSRGLGERVEGFRNLRRSSRISQQCREILVCERNGVEGFRNPRRSPRPCGEKGEKTGRGESANEEEQLGIAMAEDFAARKSGSEKLGNVSADSGAIVESGSEESRKRKMDECEEFNGAVRQWTEEQELALRRAYLVAKPTPNFWKKVSRLVPGKSAQDCFDKLNSDYATPPQREQVSRARRKNASPIPHFELSASKVLKPNEPIAKKPSCNKQKRNVAHKNARQFFKEHYRHNQVHEADLFSVLEPNLDLSAEPYQLSTTLSTPKNLHKKQELHQKFNERSISGSKKPLSRFCDSHEKALSSPPVLKQVKNRVLHERYIDQLHSRDAKRKSESKQSGKPSLKTANGKENQIPKLDVVRAAKNALVSDARDAITALQQIRPLSNSSDLEDDFFKSDSDESDIEI